MDVTKLIKASVKENKIVLGFENVMKILKIGKPSLIVYANNLPNNKIKEIEYNAKNSNVEVKKYPKDGVDLGLVCGKPFPVGSLAIKGGKK